MIVRRTYLKNMSLDPSMRSLYSLTQDGGAFVHPEQVPPKGDASKG